jgi:hypothetical protein
MVQTGTRSHQKERKKASGLYKRNGGGKIEEIGVFLAIDPHKTETMPEEKTMMEKKRLVRGSVIICNLGLGEAAGNCGPARLTRKVQNFFLSSTEHVSYMEKEEQNRIMVTT